ncbi:hypothetical protein RND71_020888 [Anisodus tanguticus]|uniref:Uncharacterized protein n=1 Tax=Anisodus tanguticus TaxID=243964 RepID=A0AAE1VEP3_9SOLA|nr:hypothetical protein RND71_020888 [Anisodus tanguticus]
MDNQRTTLLNWAYFCQGKSVDELSQTLLLTTMELENTRLKAQEELKMREDEILQLKDMLNRAINDKNEAQEKCQRLVLEKLLLQQHQFHQTGKGPLSGVSSIEDEPIIKGLESTTTNNTNFSSSDCDESIVSSPQDREQQQALPILIDKPLPENGKFLQAVMKAGPLLQTLLLAGPLPTWRHPPPPMDTYEIPPPPVVIPSQDPIFNAFNNCGRLNKKRGSSSLFDDSDSSIGTKYQRVVL